MCVCVHLHARLHTYVHALQSGRESLEHRLGSRWQDTAVDERHAAMGALFVMSEQWTYTELMCKIYISSFTIHVESLCTMVPPILTEFQMWGHTEACILYLNH
jgi:hypothetical protein